MSGKAGPADAGGDPGGVREEKLAPDAPGTNVEISPAGMELTFQADDPAAFEEVVIPEPSHEDPSREAKKISFKPSAAKHQKSGSYGLQPTREKPTQFREQFDHLMSRLEDRFQNERLSLEEKHSRELEEAMGYFSLSSGEREAKQQELQVSLLEDIGNMAQQLQELTGTLGADDDGENLTLPSDPNVLEEYAQRMQNLEEQFQREKTELEQKHATEMEEALGTLKMSREQRQTKQLELQDEIYAEIGDMARQLEELNRAKEAYESKMGMLKRQLSKDDRSGIGPRTDQNLHSTDQNLHSTDQNLHTISRRLSDVERERDAAKDELRRLKLALQVTQGDVGRAGAQASSYPLGSTTGATQIDPAAGGRQSLEEGKISGLRERIEQVERQLKEAAQTPGGSSTMKRLRDKMKSIEKDLAAAEESTKEHFALEHLRARMEKVERLLTEGERAAKDWEALDELRNKIGNVDSDLKAVEEAKKEFEALEALRAKMEAVESELKVAEQLASDRENVDSLRQRLGQVERELGVADPSGDDHASIDKLLARLAKAETTLEDARESTKISERAFAMPGDRATEKAERDEEVEKILDRLALAEKKLKAAKESAQRRQYSSVPNATRPQSATPFDERQSRIRARLQEHFEETDASRQGQEKETSFKDNVLRQEGSRSRRVGEGEYRSRVEDPRAQRSRRLDPRDRMYQYDAPREFNSRHEVPRDNRANSKEPLQSRSRLEEPTDSRAKFEELRPLGAARPLRRRRPGGAFESDIRASKSMPYSVLGDDEDKYVADLEELRYQRALLSQKLPKKKMEEEEKKADDLSSLEPKYTPSFKEAIRNEEMQRLRERMHPVERSPPKTKLPKKKPEKVKERTDEVKSGGDPPIQAAADVSGDPPMQVPSLENDLKHRLLSQTVSSGRDPKARDPGAPDSNSRDPNSKEDERGIIDPPDLIDPPATAKRRQTPKTIFPKGSPENPSDESAITPVKHPETFYDAGSISTAELPATVESEQKISPKKRVASEREGQIGSKEVTVEPDFPEPSSVNQASRPPAPRQAKVAQPEVVEPEPPRTPPPTPPALEQGAPNAQRTQSLSQTSPPAPPPPSIQIVQSPPPPAPPQQQPIFHQTTVVDGKAAARERREKDRLIRWVIVVLLCLAVVLAAVIVVVVVLLRDNNEDAPRSAPTPAPTMFPSSIPTSSASPTRTASPTQTMSPSGETLPPSLEQCPMLDSTTPLTTDGVTMQLSTVGAFYIPSEAGLMGCGFVEEIGIDGVWYAMVGKGEVVTISTCTQFFPSFDTQLVIYTPVNPTTGCREGLECVTSNDDFCGQQSSVTFIAQEGTLYFVYVSGVTNAPQHASPTWGDFSLTVSASPEGSCQGAIGPLVPSPNNQLPVIMVGDLLGGTFGVDPCHPELQTRTGELWYTVTGTGSIVVASTCHSISNFEARLAVYTGTCDVLMCITDDDEDCGNGSQINWFAEAGTEYYLLVYSPAFVPDVQFGISVQEIY